MVVLLSRPLVLWVPAAACHRAGEAGPVGRDDVIMFLPSPTRGEGKGQPSLTSNPFVTPGRAIIVAYQRFTLGKSASATL